MFKTKFASNIFFNKYAFNKQDTWADLAKRLVKDVCRGILTKDECDQIERYVVEMKFVPGGRYLYYAGRPAHTWNNCFMLKGEYDTREEWGALLQRASDCLMTGGGIGVNYDVFRGRGTPLARTGGVASGPIPLMCSINEVGRNVIQGGSRRSAIYASLGWQHADAKEFLVAKNWHEMPIGNQKRNGEPYTLWHAKQDQFNFPAPLDMTNISLNYDDAFLEAAKLPKIFIDNVRQALKTGEPGFSFNFGKQSKEILRNPCCEVTSADDSDVCNLGSVNLGAITSVDELKSVVELATLFLLCGTMRAQLPYKKIEEVRKKNRRLGLGLMGIHEWLIRQGLKYEVTDDLRSLLAVYATSSTASAKAGAARFSVSRPVATRAIAPTGTIAILAGTTTGIEPLYAVAYKRRYLTDGSRWKHEFVIDATADHLIKTYSTNPDDIETAATLAGDPERRIKFQADVQDYVDMAISSTINLPAWGSDGNSEDGVLGFAHLLRKYAPRLRGFTCYPDGSRGGQPLTLVDYKHAKSAEGVVYDEDDVCELSGKGGSCGL